MKILVTGADGFIGKNLCAALESIRDGIEKTRALPGVEEVFEYEQDAPLELLTQYCSKADAVISLDLSCEQELFDALKRCNNTCTLIECKSLSDGSKREDKTITYLLPHVFGKWSQPDYNCVSKLCHAAANDVEITLEDPKKELVLVYIDDLVNEILDALEGRVHYDGEFATVPCQHKTTIGETERLIKSFKAYPETRVMPEIPEDSLAKKLYTTYLSFLPEEKIVIPLKMNTDDRGSFTELMRTLNCGQFSVNVSKPGIVKGHHWHNTKWELFVVVSGHGLIRQRKHGSTRIIETEVSGEKIEAVHILPGYTHDIINLSTSENLVTVMWCNEQFNPNKLDTFFETV